MATEAILYLLHCRRDDLYWGANSALFNSGQQSCPSCGDNLASVPFVLVSTDLPASAQ